MGAGAVGLPRVCDVLWSDCVVNSLTLCEYPRGMLTQSTVVLRVLSSAIIRAHRPPDCGMRLAVRRYLSNPPRINSALEGSFVSLSLTCVIFAHLMCTFLIPLLFYFMDTPFLFIFLMTLLYIYSCPFLLSYCLFFHILVMI